MQEGVKHEMAFWALTVVGGVCLLAGSVSDVVELRVLGSVLLAPLGIVLFTATVMLFGWSVSSGGPFCRR